MTDYRKKTVSDATVANANLLQRPVQHKNDTVQQRRQPTSDFFDSEFGKDTTKANIRRPVNNPFATVRPLSQSGPVGEQPVLKTAKLFDYKLKFSVDNFTAGFNNDVLATRYQPYTGSLPINLSGQDEFSGMLKASIFDLMEDIRFTGAIVLPFFGTTSPSQVSTTNEQSFQPSTGSLFDGSGEYYLRFDYLKKMIDFSAIYFRQTQAGLYSDPIVLNNQYQYDAKAYTNLWEAVIKYPFNKVSSISLWPGVRHDDIQIKPDIYPYFPPLSQWDSAGLLSGPQDKQTYALMHIEYVYDNTLMKATDIWNGLRYKVYFDWMSQLNTTLGAAEGRYTYNFGFDARHYLPIYRNFIWALRAAGDFSWGNQKIVYYLGGTDGWLFPKAYSSPMPQDPSYAFQSLAVNLRGFDQNITNGNNDVVINSELRLPVFTTLFNKPINNAFLRNFSVVQFFDLGSAWNGKYNGIKRPELTVPASSYPYLNVQLKAGGIGPFAGGYGFGVRSTLLGYFLRFDAGWQMNTFFDAAPVLNVSMGVDF
jgi:hypothetical protein